MSNELTPEQKAKSEFRKMLTNTKKSAESYVVLSMYKNTELYFDSNLTIDDIHDPVWKMYFGVAENLIKKGKLVLDEIVVGLRVEENEALKKMYEDANGYQTIADGKKFVQEENFEAYLVDVKKFNALIRLHDLGFPIMEKFDAYKAMPVVKIQTTLEAVLDSVFADVEVAEKTEDLKDNLWQTVLDANEGLMRGFPYYSSMLTEFVNGMALGNLTMLSANSGMGKTYITLSQILPNMIEYNEKLMILANEEDSVKWRKEIIVWAVNNVVKKSFEKHRFNQGNFTNEELDILKEGVDWLESEMEKGNITFINFNSFSMNKAIKTIKKQSSVNGIKYFVLDTLKLDSDNINLNTQAWLQLQQGMVKLYDLIKPSNRNLHVWVTYQLGKSAMMSRFLSQNSLGMSKNVVDVVSTLLLVRKALESEKEGGKNEVEVKLKNGTKTKMSKDKEYFILFIGKNRAGQTSRQLVFEVDMGRNIMTDFGTCLIPEDI